MNFTTDQQLAIDKTGENIIVSAGAGSGKTAVLSERTIRILKEGTHINELLILSFTRVAAAEMKERIRKKIKKAIPEYPEFSKELELIDQSYITTFDSFALSIVKKYHYLLNIPHSIEVTDESIINMQKTKLLNETFDDLYKAPTQEFDQLISDFCVKNTSTLKQNILNIANKIDNMINKESYLENYETNYLSETYFNKIMNEYKDLLLDYISEIKKQEYKLSLLMDGEFNNKLSECLLPLYNSQTINEIIIHSNISLPRLPNNSEDEIKNAKDSLKKSIDRVKNISSLYGNEETIKKTLSTTTIYMKAIIDIIKRYLIKLNEYKTQNQIYSFRDIALLSIKIIKENEGVRKELSNSFKEIMVDEYQDTNDIQETFISLIENNNVYMVGDIKQSIYRFNNANPYIFKTKYDNYSKSIGGAKIDLLKNFRSRKEVLYNINEIFDLVMDDVIGGAEYHESHRMIPGNESYNTEGKTNQNYNLRILEYEMPEESNYSKEEIEVFTIANDIENKINNKYQIFKNGQLVDATYNDFVILIDRSTDFDLYKKIFEYKGIPIEVLKDETLNDSNELYVLKNIIDLLIKISNNEYDQEFKYDFISIARSYLYRFSDEEIFLCFKNNDFKNNQIYEDLSPLINELPRTTIRGLFEKIITKTNMYEKIITVGNIDSFMIRISNLLDIADNLSNIGYDIYAFNDYLKELLESNEKMKYKVTNNVDNAVKILTIHGSKGKEYPVCYFSGLYKEFNDQELKNAFLYGEKYGIISPIFNEGINDTIIKLLYKKYYKEEEISEKIRLFYVALTRAKEQMIMVIPNKEEQQNDLDDNQTIDITIRNKYNSFSDIIDSIKFKILKYYESIDIDKLGLTKDYLFNKPLTKLSEGKNTLTVSSIDIPTSEEIEEQHFSKSVHELITKDTYNNMEFGLEIHEILENIDFINPQYDLIESTFIREKVSSFLNNDLLKNISSSNIYKEYEFIYEKDNNEYHGIIDLMLEYNDHIDIIDYKLNNIKDDNYLKQLNGYKEYIKTISNKDINIYLYSILSNHFEKL